MSSLPRPSLYKISVAIACSLLAFTLSARAADQAVTADSVAQLEQRASIANPREQCFLYTQIIHAMTQQASHQIADGETEQAANTLHKVNRYAHLIHLNLSRNAKRVKDAQELMHNTTYRLAEVLHLTSGPDHDTVQEALTQLNQVNDELLAQVFTR
jgi:hypothetical protein